MPDQLIELAGTAGAERVSAGSVGAHIGTALLLGHAHADGQRLLVVVADVTTVVAPRRDLGQPALGDGRRQPQARHRRERHGDRAAVAAFHLGVHVVLGGAQYLGARPRIGPGRGVQAFPRRHVHQLVVRRMVIDLVHPVAIAVVGLELRLVGVGLVAPLDHLRAGGLETIAVQLLDALFAALAQHRVVEGGVAPESVVVLQRCRLVEHLMGVGQGVRLRDRLIQ